MGARGDKGYQRIIPRVSALGYEHTLEHPAIQLWNDTRHVLVSNGKESVMTTSEVPR